jgi:HD-like signal output (HDOD) protein
LFDVGKSDPWLYCLIEGTAELQSNDGRKLTVVGGTATAGKPLSPLKPRMHTATAVTPVAFLRLDVSELGDIQQLLAQGDYTVHEVREGGELSEQIQLHELTMLSEGLDLPSLPEVAMRARQLIDEEDGVLADVAKVVTKDPALTAKLLKAANSALYRRGSAVNTCDQAIVRIGTKVTRQLVTAFAVRGLFETDSPLLKSRMQQAWQEANEVAAISFVLAKLTRKFEPEEAMLAGLLHNIGLLPIFRYVAQRPALLRDSETMEQLILALRVRTGVTVIREWRLPAQYEAAVRDAEDWWRDPRPEPDLADIVVVARMHSQLGKPARSKLPALTSLPAFKKLMGEGATPKLSRDILEAAQEQIAEARALLSA